MCLAGRLLAAILFVLPLTLIGAQGDSTLSNELRVVSFPGHFATIRSVDFRNFDFREDFALKNGHFNHDAYADHQSFDLEAVHYLQTKPGSTDDAALVLLSYFAAGGSSTRSELALIFRVTDGHLQRVQEIQSNTHFETDAPLQEFSPRTRTLVLRTARYLSFDADCCVSAMDVITLRWNGSVFVQSAVRTELTDYGKRQRK